MNRNKKFSEKIALFIPCYNEEKRFRINEIKGFIKSYELKIDFYFIDDGSEDKTSEIIADKFLGSNSYLIKMDKNLGKGNALRKAIREHSYKHYSYYGFIDADLDIPLEQIIKLYNGLEGNDFLIAVSKRPLMGNLNPFKFRSLSSIAMVIIANKIIDFNPKLSDTQCGCKLFRSELIEICFADEFISEWLFDVEMFLRLKQTISNAREKILEVNIDKMNSSKNSNFKFFQSLKILKQLYFINSHYKG